MKNRHKLETVLFAAALALLPGCRMEDTLPRAASGTVPVKIGTRAAIGDRMDEGSITLNSVRIIAVSDASGEVAFNEYLDSAPAGNLPFEEGGYSTEVAGNFIVDVLPGSYDFYMIVNESAALRAELAGIGTRAELEAIRLTPAALSALSEASMICTGTVPDVTVEDVDEPESRSARVSLDGGDTWINTLNVPVVRAAVKLTVNVRKNTVNAADNFTITGAALSNVPAYSRLVPDHVYDGELSDDLSVFTGSVGFTTNMPVGDYDPVFAGYLLPEYLMTDPEDETSATRLVLSASYLSEGESVADSVEYTMLLLGNDAESYDLVRGNHYIVNVTITERGEFSYIPNLDYVVADWNEVAEDPAMVTIDDNIYKVSWKWADGTTLEDGGNTARVGYNSAVTIEFILDLPDQAQWTAHLSNSLDFEFVGAGSGVARTGVPYNIVVTPRNAVSTNDVFTEIYINLNNGTTEIEYDLNGDGPVGPGNRLVIRQIPSM